MLVHRIAKKVKRKSCTVKNVLGELYRLFLTMVFARVAKHVVIDKWHGELGYELLYWIPFVRYVTKKGGYQSISVYSRQATYTIYHDAFRSLCNRFEFSSDYSFHGPRKQIQPSEKRIYSNGTLFVNASTLYVLIRLVRAGYLKASWTFRFFQFPKGREHSNASSAVIWVYKNDCLDAGLDDVVSALDKIILSMRNAGNITIAYGQNDESHHDYDLAQRISTLPGTTIEVLHYDKSYNGKGFDDLISRILEADTLICTEGGGSYVGYYGCKNVISLSNRVIEHYAQHRTFEAKFEGENRINRWRAIV